MRPATLLFLAFSLSSTLAAQPCDPSQTDEVCADTTDWHRYVPLEIGNQWQYRDAFFGEPVTHWSWRVVGETEVGGVSYFEIERCDETADGAATCADSVLVRYDDEHAMLVRRDGDDEVWWGEVPCRLDVAFNMTDEGETYGCTGPGTEGVSFAPALGSYGTETTVPPDVMTGDTRKQFAWLFARDWEVFAGLGVTKFFYELEGEPSQLVYAFIGGEQVGTPAFATCDPAELGFSDTVCPDTTDWRRYFPLEVGNQWQYHVTRFIKLDYDHGTEIVGQTEIDGESYFLARSCTKVNFGELTCGSPVPIRYDEEREIVVQRGEDEEGNVVYWDYQLSDFFAPPCALGLPFGLSTRYCEDLEFPMTFSARGEYGVGYEGIGDTRKGVSNSSIPVGGMTFVAGIGPTGSDNIDSAKPEVLVYARIGDDVLGTPVFAFPTAGEPSGSTPASFALRAVYPNPASTTMTAAYSLGQPQGATLEIIDVLGRMVRTKELGVQTAGPHDTRVEIDGLAPGLYVLLLRGAAAEATRRFVVVR